MAFSREDGLAAFAFTRKMQSMAVNDIEFHEWSILDCTKRMSARRKERLHHGENQ